MIGLMILSSREILRDSLRCHEACHLDLDTSNRLVVRLEESSLDCLTGYSARVRTQCTGESDGEIKTWRRSWVRSVSPHHSRLHVDGRTRHAEMMR